MEIINPVFNLDILESELEKAEKSRCMIGIDVYDDEHYSYCLTRKTGDNIEIILSKTMHDKDLFKEEVENLAHYFDARILPDTLVS